MPFSQTALGYRIRRLAAIKPNETFNIVLGNKVIKKEIIKMNTINQLYNEGIGSDGVKLSDVGGEYSLVTMSISKEKGRPKASRNRITLKDTGEFYRSFRVYVFSGVVRIQADTIKDGKDLQDDWGDNILGLTNENKQKLINIARQEYIKFIRKKL
jgi:hypothetical protein